MPIPKKYAPCVSRLVKATGMDEKDARAAIEKVLKDAKNADGTINSQAVNETAQALIKKTDADIKMKRAEARRSALLTLQKRKTRRPRLKEKFTGRKHGRMGDVMRDELVGSARDIQAGRRSVEARVMGRSKARSRLLVTDIQKLGKSTWNSFVKGDLNDAIMVEKVSIQHGATESKTANKEAFAIAQAIVKHNSREFEAWRANGGRAQSRTDHIMRNDHDGRAVLKAGGKLLTQENKEKAWRLWREEALRTFSDEVFEGIGNREQHLENLFDNITSGIHGRKPGDLEGGVIKGTGVFQGKFGNRRVIKFKSPEAEIQYMKKYGRRQFQSAVFQDLEEMARQTALMAEYGPNYRKEFGYDIEYLKGIARDTMLDAEAEAQTLNKLFKPVEKIFDKITGELDIPENPMRARITSDLLAFKSAVALQQSVVSALGDQPIIHMAVKHFGGSRLNMLGRQVEEMVNAARRVGGKEFGDSIAARLGIVNDAYMATVAGRLMDETAQFSTTSRKMVDATMKLSGMNGYDFINRAAFTKYFVNNIADKAGVRFGDLDSYTARTFRQHDITEADWDILRKLPQTLEDGRSYITGDMIDDIGRPLDASESAQKAAMKELEEMFGASVEARGQKKNSSTLKLARDELYEKWVGMLDDEVRGAVIQPGFAQQALARGFQKPGSFGGIAFSLLGQFKAFSLGLYERGYKRAWYGGMPKEGFAGIMESPVMRTAGLVSSQVAAGYVAMTLKDILGGRKPRAFNDDAENNSKILLASAQRGVGLGVMQDFVFHAVERDYENPIVSLAGPVVSDIGDAAMVATQAAKGKDVRNRASKLVYRNIPFARMLWTKPMFDRIAYWPLMEQVDPGYRIDMQRKIEQYNNQEFFLTPEGEWMP